VAWAEELLGVDGTAVLDVREERAVSGVGALICDFLGVSVTGLLRLPPRLDDDDDDPFKGGRTGWETFTLRPAVINGCRIAA